MTDEKKLPDSTETPLTPDKIDTQSQAYYEALKKMEEEKKQEKKNRKKKRRKKRACILAILVIIYCGFRIVSDTYLLSLCEDSIIQSMSTQDSDNSAFSESVKELTSDTYFSENQKAKTLYKLGKNALEQNQYYYADTLFNKCKNLSDNYSKKIDKALYDCINKETDTNNLYSLWSTYLSGKEENLNDEENEKLYNLITALEKEKKHAEIYELIKRYTGKEDISKTLQASKYAYAVSIMNEEPEEANEIFTELDNYKKSKELEVYTSYKRNIPSKIIVENGAETELRKKLKNPSSLEVYGISTGHYIGEGESENNFKLHFWGALSYSATNSYGGRVKETYTYSNYYTIDLNGVPYDTLKKLTDMSYNELKEYANS